MDDSSSVVRELIQEGDRSKWSARSNHNVKCFTEDEIIRFTNNYETMLGKGSFGEVYKGVLEDETLVAVKKFVYKAKESFAKELTVHREINHKNVVRLLGYCLDENAVMMVTEYIPNGNLSEVLHGDNTPLSLDMRLRIAIECADALEYMHSGMYTQVIHGDIKPANILLDDGLGAKVSDFGISRLINTENTLYTRYAIGSVGYMDPLFYQNCRLTVKSDVYSFGVVLLELITRKKARTNDGDISLVGRFTKALGKGVRTVRAMLDAEIAVQSNMKTIEEVAKLAGKCLRMEVDKRPEMSEVAYHLRRLRKAPQRGQELLGLLFWRKKSKLPQADPLLRESRLPQADPLLRESKLPQADPLLRESSSSDHYMGTAALPERTTSEESSSRQYAGSVTPAEGTPSEEGSRPESPRGLIFTVGSTMTSLFDMEDLLRGSAEVLGKGTVGTTYKATLESGVELVVKRMRSVDVPREEFILRLRVTGAIQNKHIAPLHCYYYSNDEKLLVYNIFPMGSLSSALHGSRLSGRGPLDWEQRAAIALAAARGVAYIHSAGLSSCHGNIKSSNVMLTGTHDASVSEHGLATLGLFPCTSGYRAPEITDNKSVSQKADVYSFGILLMELLTGRAPDLNLAQWVCSVAREEWVAEVFDVQLVRCVEMEECMSRLLQLAINCCNKNATLRPTISDVVQQIEEIR